MTTITRELLEPRVVLLLASDFSFIFNMFRFVVVLPFFAVGVGVGAFVGFQISPLAGRVGGKLTLIASTAAGAAVFTWIGNMVFNLAH